MFPGGRHTEFEPADPEYADRVRQSFGRQAVMSSLGVEISDLGPGWIELSFAPPAGFTQQDGYLHAGVAATVLDSACGYAALSLIPPGGRVLTSGYKIDLLRPAHGDQFTALGWVVKPGSKLTVSSAELTAIDGKTAAIMTGTIVSLRQDR